MPFLRFSRDRRGNESTFLVHTFRRQGKSRSQVLYWFRSPPGVKVGRSALDDHAIRLLEESYPDVAFDWAKILKHRSPPRPVTDRREPRRRRRTGAPQGPVQKPARSAKSPVRPTKSPARSRPRRDVPADEQPGQPPPAPPANGSAEVPAETVAEAAAVESGGTPPTRRRRSRRGGARRTRRRRATHPAEAGGRPVEAVGRPESPESGGEPDAGSVVKPPADERPADRQAVQPPVGAGRPDVPQV